MFGLHPLVILCIGILTVLGMIIVLRVHAFLSLISAAIVVSVLSPGGVGCENQPGRRGVRNDGG